MSTSIVYIRIYSNSSLRLGIGHNVAELQVMYSEKPELTTLKCESKGFELGTSDGALTFNDGEMDRLRLTPRDLDKPVP